MTVDHSYSDYEAIRTYQDRGMMKWGTFAMGELSTAQQEFSKHHHSEEIKASFSLDQVLQILNLSYSNGRVLEIKYYDQAKLLDCSGFVSGFFENSVRIKGDKITKTIPIESIINIK